MTTRGEFDSEFARRKDWKRDPGLATAILDYVGHAQERAGRALRICDYGAGIGQYVALLREHGYDAMGLDGIDGIIGMSEGRVRQANFTEDACWRNDWGAPPDIALSFEVGEHIPAEFAGAYLRWLTGAARHGILMSWAVPGQRGRGHVNCRSPEWVACAIGQTWSGYAVDEDATDRARKLAGKGWDRKLLAFHHPALQ